MANDCLKSTNLTCHQFDVYLKGSLEFNNADMKIAHLISNNLDQ